MKALFNCIVFFNVLFISPSVQADDFQVGQNHDSNIIYLALPSGINSEQLKHPDQITSKIIHDHVSQKIRELSLNRETFKKDIIVIFVDEHNKPILPDLSFCQKDHRQTSNELTFVFNSSIIPWDSAKISVCTSQLNEFYPTAKSIYGNPAFNISVNILLDTTIGVEAMYNSTTNEITLYDTAFDVICHEMIHAFHDDDIINISTFEEGMARAAEIEVFNQLDDYLHWDEHRSYSYDYYYEALNQIPVACVNGNVFSNYTLTFLKYQISSMIWGKMYIEDRDYFKKFNDTLYTRILIYPNLPFDESLLRNIVYQCKQNVENIPIVDWYKKQNILNASPDTGYFLYQRINQFTIDYFHRPQFGLEAPQGNSTIYWELYDFNDNLLDSNHDITTSYGFISINSPAIYNTPGRIKVIAWVNTPAGILHDTIYRSDWNQNGIFGIIEDAINGTVVITPLDTNINSESAAVTNGEFLFPAFEQIRGRFLIDFTYPDCRHIQRTITKDASLYYVRLYFDSAYINPDWASINALGSTRICSGDTVELDVDVGTNYSYQWIKNSVVLPGQITSMLPATSSGVYEVVLFDGTCMSHSPSIQITVNPLPAPNLGNDTIITSSTSFNLDPGGGFSSYVWSTGETTQTIQINHSDTFFVTVSDSNNCRNSDSIAVTITTLADNSIDDRYFQIFPNPSNGALTISFVKEIKERIIVEIYNYLGQSVYFNESFSSDYSSHENIYLKAIPGIYFVKLKDENKNIVRKFLIE